MDNLFISTISKTTISVEPKYLNNNIDRVLLTKLKDNVEGKCIKDGYVKKNSVKIIKRSAGVAQISGFNGSSLFHIMYSIDVCNPLEGHIIEVQALNINKMGIFAGVPYEQNSPINVMIAKQHHIDNPKFDKIKENDIFKIKVIGKRYEYGDTSIQIIGIIE